jgi:glutathione peroxidase
VREAYGNLLAQKREGALSATAYDFRFEALRGGALPLSDFRGRPLLIVNTASQCGFTPQYAGLGELWRRHRDAGLVVLGVPSNDFGGQEPGSSDEIASFCDANYGIDFPMTAKVSVQGAAAHPLFRWLADQGGFLSRPRWNFYKYLIARDGRLATWFASITTPQSPRLGRAIAAAIASG